MDKMKIAPCCRDGVRTWCKKYFWAGPALRQPGKSDEMIAGLPWYHRLLIKYRRIIGFMIPAITFDFFWLAIMIKWNLWHLFPEKYIMTITMVFVAIIAGMTGVGGGALAFPVMTLALKISPSIARDFSLILQACGLSAATFSIIFMGIKFEWRAVLLSSLGGVAGVIFGLHIVDPVFTTTVKKLGFVSIWFAFVLVLFVRSFFNRKKNYLSISHFNWWKMIVLAVTGFIGGIFTSLSSSGIDICNYMILTLLFNVNEKVVTPTSTMLLAINAAVASFWRGVIQLDISDDAWEYVAVCIPVVTVLAPLGSVIGSYFHRLVLASLVIILFTIAFISAFVIIKPLPPALIGGCVGVAVGSIVINVLLAVAGRKLMNTYEKEDEKIAEDAAEIVSTSRNDYTDDSYDFESDLKQDHNAESTHM